MKILRPYQKEVIDKVTSHLLTDDRCCVSLATGGGKTVIFSQLVPLLSGRVLICVHREELVHQTSATLQCDHDILIPKTKKVSKDICVAMIQTLSNRIKKGEVDVNSYDNIIVDESHRGDFLKVLDIFNGKVIGFTATPNYEKTRTFFKCLVCGNEHKSSGKCCNKKTEKYRENVPLSRYYDTLIEGVSIGELISQGFLVPEEDFILKTDTTNLVYDYRTGDYTEESIGVVFGSPEAIKNTIHTYRELALGKKTILFNPNTLVNKLLYKAMVDEGLNVKMYDSQNVDENRVDLVEWFKNTSDAILLNVQVFTTGFDCSDVEVVFLNKKTKSLNLYHQMIGRGGRITDKIFKPSFTVIDMGNNNEDFGKWSDEVSWDSYFYRCDQKPVGKPLPASVRNCHSCDSIIASNSLKCEVCGAERVYTDSGGLQLPIRNGKPVIPAPEMIVEYCLKNDLDTLVARKLVYEYASKMFAETPVDVFLKHKNSGLLFDKAMEFFKPYYFAIQKSELKGNRIVKMIHFTNEIVKSIERSYEK